MIRRLRVLFEDDPRVTYAILFGSKARGTAHGSSDTDLAIGLARGARLSAPELGDLVSRLENVAGGRVDLVLLDEAGPSLAYRAFRDGRVIFERDHRALVERVSEGRRRPRGPAGSPPSP